MAKFAVDLYYEELGQVIIEAESFQHAQALVEKKLEESGLDELELDCTDRQYGVTNSEEISYG